MSIEYTWHSVGSESCYNCYRHDGKVFKKVQDIPELPVHPNCNCYVIASGMNEEESEKVANELDKTIHSAKGDMEDLSKYFSLTDFKSDAKDLYSELKQTLKTLEIFWDNYQDMKEANTIGADKYFHSKANAEASSLGETAETVAKFISDTREVIDVYKNILVKKMSFEKAMEDGQSDLKANQYGRDIGRKYPKDDIRHHLGLYRPDGLDDKY